MGVTKNLIYSYALIIAVVGVMPSSYAYASTLENNTKNTSINTAVYLTQLASSLPANDKNISNANPLEDELLKKAETTIQQWEEASEVSKENIDYKKVYIDSYQPIEPSIAQNQQQSSTNIPYTNLLRPPAPPVRKIPESSSLLGLVGIAAVFGSRKLGVKN